MITLAGKGLMVARCWCRAANGSFIESRVSLCCRLALVAIVAAAPVGCRGARPLSQVRTSQGTVHARELLVAQRYAAALESLSPKVIAALRWVSEVRVPDVYVEEEPWKQQEPGRFIAGSTSREDGLIFVVRAPEPLASLVLAHELVHYHANGLPAIPEAIVEGFADVMARRCVPAAESRQSAQTAIMLASLTGGIRLRYRIGGSQQSLIEERVSLFSIPAGAPRDLDSLLLLDDLPSALNEETLLARALGFVVVREALGRLGDDGFHDLLAAHENDPTGLLATLQQLTQIRSCQDLRAVIAELLDIGSCEDLADELADGIASTFAHLVLDLQPFLAERPAAQILDMMAPVLAVGPHEVVIRLAERPEFVNAFMDAWKQAVRSR